MAKVFPAILPASASTKSAKAAKATRSPAEAKVEVAAGDLAVLTVWKKSLLLNCSGFTVYDGKGNLVYRVDSYAAGNKAEILLMDADGKPILTMRRKRLSLGETWMVYDGEKTSDPIFSVHRHVNFRRSKTIAHVTSFKSTSCSSSPFSSPDSFPSSSPEKSVVCKIEGSYKKRVVSVFDGARRCLAETKRKEAAGGIALGVDVFRLIVTRPYIDTAPAMALVVLLDRMFGSVPSSSSSARWISC